MPVPVYDVNRGIVEYFPSYDEIKAKKCRYIWVTLLIIFILATVSIISYLTMAMPKLPHFHVNSLSLTNFTSTNNVTGTWDVGFLVQNPNKILNIKFISLQPTIFYNDLTLSASQIMPFMQSSRSNTIRNVTFSAVNFKVEKYYLDGINKERKLGSVGFNVKLNGHIKFKFYKKKQVHVLCSDIVVRISSNSTSGKLDGGAKKCHVDSN